MIDAPFIRALIVDNNQCSLKRFKDEKGFNLSVGDTKH